MTATRILASLVLVAGLATGASAGVVDLYWNGCVGTPGIGFGPPVVNLSPGGNAFFPHQQFISLSNHVLPANDILFGHGAVMSIGPTVPDAWRFDAAGCMTANFSQITYNTLGVAGCPGLRLGTEVPIYAYTYDGISGKAVQVMETAYPAGNAAPAALALMFNIQYNMAAAGAACAPLQVPVCFHLTRSSTTEGPGPTTAEVRPQPQNQSWVTYEDVDNQLQCPLPTQTFNTSWGNVKGLYR